MEKIRKEKRKLLRGSISENILYGIVFIIFMTFALSYIYIFLWGVLAGLKTHDELVLQPFTIPAHPRWGNYIEVFNKLNVAGYTYWGMLFNSIYFSVLGQFIGCMCSCMLAYVTCKYKFPGAKLYFAIVTIMIILPIYGNGGSMYRLMYRLGMIDSYAHILTAFGGMNIYYLYFHAAFENVSDSYAEAALIDGANDFTVFFKVVFPQVINIFGALFLLRWVADWNNYSSVLIYLSKLPTLAGGIYLFELDVERSARLDLVYAAYMISAVPPLVLFAVCNQTLTSNVSLGGLKE